MPDKTIKVAVSSCLLGNRVRYDGQHKYNFLIVNMLEEFFETLVVCPEMLAGLGTPRPPVQLVELANNTHALGVEDKSLDVTELIEKVATDFIEQHNDLGGLILQSRSPSCGFGSTPLYNQQKEIIRLTNGIFADKVATAFPDLPIKEDSWFETEDAVVEFVKLVNRYHLKTAIS
jgi:uncharacterized protein YbbK (DUF523 family)